MKNTIGTFAFLSLFMLSCGKYADNAKQEYRPLPSFSPKEEEKNNRENYAIIEENRFLSAKNAPLSTFSIDVDRASYSNVRRFIKQGQLPPKDAVRVEEMVNYFSYEYPQPQGEAPFHLQAEVADCPWAPQHKLMLIGMQGKKMDLAQVPNANFVYLLDVSGSMDAPDKLPLLKQSLYMLTENLRPQDKVAIVVYAGAAGVVLPSTAGNNKGAIYEALEGLHAGGSTAGGEGLMLAYKIAKENFIPNGNNRIILATDGDFNVGLSSDREMEDLIVEKRKEGIFLTCLGFGQGNLQDAKMEILADKGNGNYAYIDDVAEARKTLVTELGGTLYTIAKDVKLQVEFNPAKVNAYRLIGYENRMLNTEDFADDKKDAGELGAGHTVTAIYEIIPAGVTDAFTQQATTLKYTKSEPTSAAANANEWATLNCRYKAPQGEVSKAMTQSVATQARTFETASENLRFASAVALYGLILRDSEFKGNGTLNMVKTMAQSTLNYDPQGYRKEFVKLVTETPAPVADKK